MSKRRRSPSLPLGREDLNHSRRELKALFALDELFLRVLSFLPARDLARAQGVSRHWERMALDPQLWKQLYLDRYPHPHSSRLVYTRSQSARSASVTAHSGASTPLRPIARLPSRAFPPPSPSPSPAPSGAVDDDLYGLDRPKESIRHDGVDWKVMMRLGTNWSNGNVLSESSVLLPPSPQLSGIDRRSTPQSAPHMGPYSQQHLALFPSFICTSSSASPLVHVHSAHPGSTPPLGIIPPPPGWSSPSRPDNVTAIAADQAVVLAEPGIDKGTRPTLPARLAIFYASGGFAIVRVRLLDGRLVWAREAVSTIRSRPKRRNSVAPADGDAVVLAMLHYPVLVTCTIGFHVSIYSLRDATLQLERTLHSDVSFHPAALTLFPPEESAPAHARSFRAALTYCSPVYPASWTVAVQEFTIDLAPNGSANVHRGECHHAGRESRAEWPVRLEPLVGVRGRAVDIGSDGRWCVLAGEDSVIHVYSLPTGSEDSGIGHAMTLLAPSSGVHSIALAAGRCVVGGSDGRVHVWELDEGLDGDEGEALVGRTIAYVEIKQGGRRRREGDVSPGNTTPSSDDERMSDSRFPHPASISTAARGLFLADPPASMRPAMRSVHTADGEGSAIRGLAFDEEKIVGLVGSAGEEAMRVWSFS